MDRLALSSKGQENLINVGHSVAPNGHLEQELVRIWKELLDIRAVGIKNNRFDLGGESMFVIRLSTVNRDYTLCGIRLSINDLFAHPTIEGLAALIHRRDSEVI